MMSNPVLITVMHTHEDCMYFGAIMNKIVKVFVPCIDSNYLMPRVFQKEAPLFFTPINST